MFKYQNGPVNVTIYEDGTKIREWDDAKYGITPKLEFPESFDCKITNKCSGVECIFCHENSTPNGSHGDLKKLNELLEKSNLPAGIEIAIGGGNPCEHPDLTWFLKESKKRGHIINMTMNYRHINSTGKFRYQVLYYLLTGLIKGLGISVRFDNINKFLEDTELQEASSNIVLHIIEGINQYSDISNILYNCNWKNPKVLILGYKCFGRALRCVEPKSSTEIWKNNIKEFVKTFKGVVSFDNLAIKRLDILNQFPKEIIDKNYMGEDGTHTMYIDMVSEKYAKQSTSTQRKSINNLNLREMYIDIFEHRNDWL